MSVLVDVVTCRQVLDQRALIAALRDAMIGEAEGQVQQPARLNLSSAGGFFRLMPAVLDQRGVMGVKIFNGSAELGVRYLTALYDAATAELLALVDASWLTAARTGAAAAVAFAALARPGAARIGVIGAGLEARENLRAFAAVRPLESAAVFSPRPASRAAFARAMTDELGVPVTARDTPEAAVTGAGAVIVATNTGTASPGIAYRGEWMEPGQHVSSIGSTSPRLRELDPSCFRTADLVVLDAPGQAEEESGDLIAARRDGSYQPGTGRALADVVAGRVAGRTAAEQVTLYKSVGTAVQDLVAADVVARAAITCGAAREIGEIAVPKAF